MQVALGGVFAVFGPIVLFADSLQVAVNILSILQGFWFLGGAIAVLAGVRQVASTGSHVAQPAT